MSVKPIPEAVRALIAEARRVANVLHTAAHPYESPHKRPLLDAAANAEAALTAAQQQGQADARRYRWLREQDNDDFRFAVVKNPHFDVFDSAEELDSAIDAAIAASGESDE